jgi:CheY-like chemotaxis protein
MQSRAVPAPRQETSAANNRKQYESGEGAGIQDTVSSTNVSYITSKSMTPRGNKYILIVDDDDDIRLALAEVLEDEGYQVKTAANGSEALAVLRSSESPCMILLDLMMPVMDGWTFREHQLKDAALAEIPVYVISAAGNVAGAPVPKERFIPKPIMLDHLLSLVETAC